MDAPPPDLRMRWQLAPHMPRTGGLAPVIARSRGRAGRVKAAKRRSTAQGSLEATKRPLTIGCRSDARMPYLQQPDKAVGYGEFSSCATVREKPERQLRRSGA